jgi:hypothetical protein
MNPWKLTTIGMALVLSTALITGLTTAYFTRPGAALEAEPASTPPTAAAPVYHVTHPTARHVAARVAPAPITTSSVASAPVPVATPVSTVALPSTPVTSAPSDCATGGDRAVRIAKPGIVGTLLGAGLGAAGGAIADGGKGAGTGALIGGLAGAALGTGYGAYQTKQECGTVFGESRASLR